MLYEHRHQIIDIKDQLEQLVEKQANSVESLAIEQKKISREIQSELDLAKEHIRDMVVAGDDANYAKIGELIQEAGATYNFPKMIQDWQESDDKNRAARQELVSQHGRRSEVTARIQKLEAEISETDEALSEMQPEIEAFEETTTKIEAHNKKYPKLPIEEGMHDNYEKFGFWRWVGYVTLVNRAPHSAYKALGDYTENYGDYYKDSRDIATLRKNEDVRSSELEAMTSQLNAEKAIMANMDALDSSYKGPDGIAAKISKRVYDFMRTDDDYADILYDKSGLDSARQASLRIAKAEAMSVLKDRLDPFLSNAEETLEELKQGLRSIPEIPADVEDKHVDFDLDNLVRDVTRGAANTRKIVLSAQKSRIDMDEFVPTEDQDFAAVKIALAGKKDRGYLDNAVSVNFVNLGRNIGHVVSEYRAEQRLIEQERIAAAQARADRLRESREISASFRERRIERSAKTAFTPAANRVTNNHAAGKRERTRITSVQAGTSGISGNRRRR